MSTCNTCAKGFGFFNKEHGCPRCKKIFCKSCLGHKVPESSENLKKMIYVCLRCSRIPLDERSQKVKNQDQIEEILKLNPKEEAFEPVLEPVPSSKFTDDIRQRLDDLKNVPEVSEGGMTNTDDDIRDRLAKLKGFECKTTVNKDILMTDTRSEQEKIEDLLKQFVEERAIDNEAKPEINATGTIGDIERRLAALRGQDIEKTKQQIEQTEETEEEEIARTLKQYLEEATLEEIVVDPEEEELIAGIPPAPGQGKNLEELPFCEICNEDASLRCLECENLFCASCFKEFHDEEDYKTHKTKPYRAPQSTEL